MVGGAEGVEKAFGGGRGKNLADGHRIHQAWPNIAEERRLMPGAAAGDNADAALG